VSVLNREWIRAKWRWEYLSCIKLRIDYFNVRRDTWGGTAGETVLGTVGQILKSQCRFCDILFRTDMGGFLALLPESDRKGASLVAERVCTALIELLGKEFEDAINPQVAIGISTYPEESIKTQQDLLQAALGDMDREKELTKKQAV